MDVANIVETLQSLDFPTQLAILGTTTAVAIGMIIMFASRHEQTSSNIPHDNQSIEIEPGVRGSALAPDGKLLDYVYEDSRTVHECFKRGIRESNNGPCLGVRNAAGDYEWQSYQEVFDKAARIGSGLVSKGLAPSSSTFIGIFSANCPEWVICAEACNMFSMCVVPLYDTLGIDACNFIINQTEMEIVIVDKAEKALSLLKNNEKIPSLRRIVVIDELSNNNFGDASERGIDVLTLAELETIGANNPHDAVPPKPDDVCTICYTSGTTGDPKGVMLTHRNLVSDASTVVLVSQISLTSEDVHLSYLPLAHMMERIVHTFLYTHGSRIGFFGGDVKKLLDDLRVLRPTVFITVPRLLNRIYDKVMLGVNQAGGIKKLVFNIALNRKKALLAQGVITNESIWDRLVFKKIQDMLGGRVRMVVTGSAPLSSAVLDFARCAFGCMLYEGYGQTECTAACTVTITGEKESGHVGAPLPCNLIKLIDVPEMEYYAAKQQGEVCIKGHNVMKGYYKDPKKTAEALDSDGWLRSGDIGMWRPNGTLKIIDRRKHIFKLAQGEYLAPEKIENIYVQCPLVAQAFVDGDSLETFAVAVIVPDPETMPPWAKDKGLSGNMAELCKNSEVKKEILAQINKKGKEAGLKGFEQAREIMLYPEMFSSENGLLTPTFKSKRPALRKHFAQDIADMYKVANSA